MHAGFNNYIDVANIVWSVFNAFVPAMYCVLCIISELQLKNGVRMMSPVTSPTARTLEGKYDSNLR